MNVNGIFGALGDALGRIVKDTVKLRSLKKEDLQNLLNENIRAHEQLADLLLTGETRDLNLWVKNKVNPVLHQLKDASMRDTYLNFVKALHGKASSEERTRALGALQKANAAYAKVLQEISNNIDKLMEEEAVDVFHIRVTHIAALGIIRQSDAVCNYTVYLYTLMTRAAIHEVAGIPKYRLVYLRDHTPDVANYVSDILDKKGIYTFLNDVKTLRSRAADVVLGASGSFDFRPGNLSGFYMPNFIDTLTSALSALNIFRAAMDAWDDYQLAKYERNKEMKEWLESHVALLRMDLTDMDQTSPEYIQMTNIIQAYDDKIAEYDRDILAFENAE